MRYSLLALAIVAAAAPAAPVAELSPVVVTASRSSHQLAEAPASVSVISAGQIRASGASTVLDALRTVPGLTLNGRQVGGRKTLSIRGAEDRHTLILIDGRRISSTDDTIGHSDYQYNWVPLEQIERIEVVRGPMSALYGSEAVGGVINIITRKAQQPWQGRAYLRGDQGAGEGGDGHQLSANVGGALGPMLDLMLGAEHSRRTPTASEEDPRTSAIEGSELKSANLRLGFNPLDGQRLQLDLLQTDETRERDEQYAYGARPYYQDTYELERRNHALTWTGDWNLLRSELRYSESGFKVENERSQNLAPTRPQELEDKIWDGSLAFDLGMDHAITLGAENRDEELTNAGLIGGSDRMNHRALFAQDEIALTDSLMLTLGARLDRHELFGNETSPRAYLVWQATSELTLKGGYGEAFRAPTLKQISPQYVGAEGPHTFYGNPDIQPETSSSWELAADWRNRHSAYTLTLFHNEIDDLIYFDLIQQVGPRRFYRYDNLEHARIDGVEVALEQTLGAGFSLSASMAWLDTEDVRTGNKLPGRAEFTATPALQWQQGRFSSRLEWQFMGHQWLKNNAQVLEETPSYSLVNLSGRFQWNEQLGFDAGVNNLGDTRLEEKSELFGYVEDRRTIWLGMEVGF